LLVIFKIRRYAEISFRFFDDPAWGFEHRTHRVGAIKSLAASGEVADPPQRALVLRNKRANDTRHQDSGARSATRERPARVMRSAPCRFPWTRRHGTRYRSRTEAISGRQRPGAAGISVAAARQQPGRGYDTRG
jgi:hypothetical protein